MLPGTVVVARLIALDRVRDLSLYHVGLPNGDVATVQLDGSFWRWRHLRGPDHGVGPRSDLERWLRAQGWQG